MNQTNKCCEKCYNPTPGGSGICIFDACPCHQPATAKVFVGTQHCTMAGCQGLCGICPRPEICGKPIRVYGGGTRPCPNKLPCPMGHHSGEPEKTEKWREEVKRLYFADGITIDDWTGFIRQLLKHQREVLKLAIRSLLTLEFQEKIENMGKKITELNDKLKRKDQT